MLVRLVGPALLALALVGCSQDEEIPLVPVPEVDAGQPQPGATDAGLPPAQPFDAGTFDAGLPPADAGTDAGTVTALAINAGGPAAPPFTADQGFSGGMTATNWMGEIDTAGVPNAAPAAVYQTERYGEMAYTFDGLTAGATYSVRLHFCENYWTKPGERLFHVAINGARVLDSYDVFVAAGASHRAHVRQFTAIADANGRILIGFTSVVNHGLINGIELF